jgi:hypothetical protein
MALFTEDADFEVYMNAKDPTPSQEFHSHEARKRRLMVASLRAHFMTATYTLNPGVHDDLQN